MFKKNFALLLFILINLEVNAQDKISGQVRDSLTGETLAFVNLSTDGRYGTSTDINGNFELKQRPQDSTLLVSYVGYKTLRITKTEWSEKMRILLAPSASELDEVVIVNGENPAHRIIREVIKNKPKNNPLELEAYSYQSYNKFVWSPYSSGKVPAAVADTLLSFFSDKHLLVMETISEKDYKAANLHKETILATKLSGFPNPPFVDLVTNYQTFGFYADQLTIYNRTYINPISEGTFRRYSFFLEETLLRGSDTVFVISYSPQKGKNFEGLEGILYINSHGYAIQNVIAEAANKQTWLIQIEHEYALNGDQWFPEEMHINLQIPNYLNKESGMGLSLDAKSFLSKVQINPKLKNRDFGWLNTTNAKDYTQKDSAFWQENRSFYLTDKEKRTYKVIDSISNEVGAAKIVNVLTYLANDQLPLYGPISLHLSKTLRFNQFENVRVGLGLQTNNRLSEYFGFGGYAGYGIKDERWKYGGFMELRHARLFDFNLRASYQNDITEPGQINWLESTPLIVSNSNRNFLASKMFASESWRAELTLRPLRFMRLSVGYMQQSYDTSTFDFEYRYENEFLQHFDNKEFSIRLRYAYNEQFSQLQGATISRGTRYPILNLYYTRGNFREGVDYERYAVRLDKTFYTKTLGNSTLSLEAGQVSADVPYTHTFQHGGMAASQSYAFFNVHNFQTMGLYEFAATQFFHAFWKHDFGALLFRSKRFRPSISIVNAYGWGKAENRTQSSLVFYEKPNKEAARTAPSDYQKGYWESGLHLKNLLFYSVSVGKIGIGAGLHYRYGAYQNPNQVDNFAFKLLTEFVF